MRRILIWGGGGHGKVVSDIVRSAGYEILGFVDADPDKLGKIVEPGGSRVRWPESELKGRLSTGRGIPGHADAIALAIGNNALRLGALGLLSDDLAPAIVHPSAVVSPSATLGSGTIVFPGAVINASAQLGRAVIVNSGAVVEHDCVIGDGVHLSPRSTLGGGVHVGGRSWIGAGATVIHLVVIGADTTVGAGATVIRDVPDGLTVVGVPAKPVLKESSRGKA